MKPQTNRGCVNRRYLVKGGRKTAGGIFLLESGRNQTEEIGRKGSAGRGIENHRGEQTGKEAGGARKGLRKTGPAVHHRLKESAIEKWIGADGETDLPNDLPNDLPIVGLREGRDPLQGEIVYLNVVPTEREKAESLNATEENSTEETLIEGAPTERVRAECLNETEENSTEEILVRGNPTGENLTEDLGVDLLMFGDQALAVGEDVMENAVIVPGTHLGIFEENQLGRVENKKTRGSRKRKLPENRASSNESPKRSHARRNGKNAVIQIHQLRSHLAHLLRSQRVL